MEDENSTISFSDFRASGITATTTTMDSGEHWMNSIEGIQFTTSNTRWDELVEQQMPIDSDIDAPENSTEDDYKN